MSTSILVVVQARIGGSRVPGKVLRPLCGQPMLLWQLDRLSRMQTPHTLVVACPNDSANYELTKLLQKHGYNAERPDVSENDVLARFQAVAQDYEAEQIVRLTGDCPLIDAAVVDRLIEHHRRSTWTDYTGLSTEWGDGFDGEAMSRNALEIAHAEATMPSSREHVSPYLYRHPERFRIGNYACPFDLSWLKCSVDTQDDFVRVELLLKKLLRQHGNTFGWRDVWLAIEDMPGMKAAMAAQVRNVSYVAQVEQEQGALRSWGDLRYHHNLTDTEV